MQSKGGYIIVEIVEKCMAIHQTQEKGAYSNSFVGFTNKIKVLFENSS
jgi:hypothetical protein